MMERMPSDQPQHCTGWQNLQLHGIGGEEYRRAHPKAQFHGDEGNVQWVETEQFQEDKSI